jgi:undecaprenyl-diphosphatase
MFAVIVYFWNAWRRDYFSQGAKLKSFAIQIAIATVLTVVVGYGLKEVIVKIFMRGVPHAEIEDLFSNLPLIATALAAAGALIIYAGTREVKYPRQIEIDTPQSCVIGIVQGIAIPFRGFSRSGSTISTGLLLGLPKHKLEEFSFALAVVLTPAVMGYEGLRLLKNVHATGAHISLAHVFGPSLVGMVFSFLAGLVALKWLSSWLEGGRWKFFGYYCLIAAAAVLALHFTVLK